jgi:hypothetical protein
MVEAVFGLAFRDSGGKSQRRMVDVALWPNTSSVPSPGNYEVQNSAPSRRVMGA